MAKIICVVLVLLLVAVSQVSSATPPGCSSEYGCNYPQLAEYSRKMLMDMKRSSDEMMKSDVYNEAELRSIPSGPDPLHHNGGSHKRPKSSP